MYIFLHPELKLTGSQGFLLLDYNILKSQKIQAVELPTIVTTNQVFRLPIYSHLPWQTPSLLQRSVYIGVVGHSSEPFSEPCQEEEEEEGQHNLQKIRTTYSIPINMINREIQEDGYQLLTRFPLRT